MLCPSGCNIRRLLDHSGGGFRDLIIIQINLRACKEVAFSQTEQKPRIHLNAAVTVFAGVFSASIVFVCLLYTSYGEKKCAEDQDDTGQQCPLKNFVTIVYIAAQ